MSYTNEDQRADLKDIVKESKLHPLFAKLTDNFQAAAGIGMPEKNEIDKRAHKYI